MYFEIILVFVSVGSTGGTICFSDKKVYFHAWNSATKYNITEGTTIVFDQTLTNSGNGYNKKTGTFTAPRDGAFVFTWTVLTVDKHWINLHLTVNDKRVSVAQADGGRSEGQHGSGTNNVVVELDRGDQVSLKCGGWGDNEKHQLYGETYSSFSGWTI